MNKSWRIFATTFYKFWTNILFHVQILVNLKFSTTKWKAIITDTLLSLQLVMTVRKLQKILLLHIKLLVTLQWQNCQPPIQLGRSLPVYRSLYGCRAILSNLKIIWNWTSSINIFIDLAWHWISQYFTTKFSTPLIVHAVLQRQLLTMRLLNWILYLKRATRIQH